MKFKIIIFFINVSLIFDLHSATIYREISSEDRIVAMKIGTAKIRTGYHRVIHTIDLEAIEANLDYIKNIASNISIINHLRDTVDFKLQSAYKKLHHIKPKKYKRGLINGLGTIIKLIAGNPDQDDLDIINSNLESIEHSENNISANQNAQVIINSEIQKSVNKMTETLKKIENQIGNQIKFVKIEMEQVNLIFNLDVIIKLLEDIEEQITFARSNLLNKNILTANETEYIWQKLAEQRIILNFKEEISQYTSCIVTVKNTKIFLTVKNSHSRKKRL